MLNKIIKWFSPPSDGDQKLNDTRQTNASHVPIRSKARWCKNADSHPELVVDLADAISSQLKALRWSKQKLPGLQLNLLPSECQYLAVLQTTLFADGFGGDLKNRLSDKGFNWTASAIVQVSIARSIPAGSTDMGEGLYLQVAPPNNVGSQIRISAIKGELSKADYQLPGIHGRQYSIGRGQNPLLANGRPHKNEIAIKDSDEFLDPEDVQARLNKFVSRRHASIGYRVGSGFFLKVHEGGCYLEGNRTRILRGTNDTIEVDNAHLEYALQNDDILELGKSVLLHLEIQ